MKNNRILALSGNDIFSGGGLSADLATYTLNGLHGFVAVTCLTALTEKGFEVFPTDDAVFQHELDSLRDVEFAGIKIGLLPTVGVTAHEVDRAAREVIEKAGYGEYFNHRLGHGIGMDVHEFPSIMEGNDMVIEEGMCFSVEPGIYIPGKVGVRIEDCGVVTKDGFDLFTNTSKDLLYFD